jgi:hypothetical protein
MPSRPFQPCKEPGCAKLVAKGYCPAHQREDNRRYYERRRADPVLIMDCEGLLSRDARELVELVGPGGMTNRRPIPRRAVGK